MSVSMATYRMPSRLSNCTRQGCNLSPLIFVITLEPLLQRLRSNPDIKGITIAQHTYKLAAFADDILLFLTDLHITIPNILKDFATFKNMTNLQINFNKSKALNISLDKDVIHHYQSNFPFKWNMDLITYLGIQLPTHLSKLYSKNYIPILQCILKDLKSWSTGLFSWFGRSSIIKMNILPRILYILQTVPINWPLAFFKSIRKACSTFIWGNMKPRISFDRLTIPKFKGGIGLPDTFIY